MLALRLRTLQACMLRLPDLGGGDQGNPIESTCGSLLDMGRRGVVAHGAF